MFDQILSDFQVILEDPGPFLQFVIVWGGGAVTLMLAVWLVLPPLIRGFLRSLDRVFPGGFEWLQADLSSMIVRAAWIIIVIATIEISAAFALGYSSLARGSMASAGQWVLESAIANAVPVVLIVVGGIIAMRIVRFSVSQACRILHMHEPAPTSLLKTKSQKHQRATLSGCSLVRHNIRHRNCCC